MNSIYICTLRQQIQTQKSQRCSVAYCNLLVDTEHAMGTVPIAYWYGVAPADPMFSNIFNVPMFFPYIYFKIIYLI